MGDEQQRPLPFRPAVLEMFGKPVDRHDVQMVGGLVEREDVPILEQQPGQVGAASLASGQRATRALRLMPPSSASTISRDLLSAAHS